MTESEMVEDDWDKFRAAHEPEEHWELRRNFLKKNEGKYDTTRLVCLSQAFANMEFLGCRYPAETMELVAGLSEGVVEEYRIKKRTRLQRTFVKASDAAERKTKGLNTCEQKPVVFSPASKVQQTSPVVFSPASKVKEETSTLIQQPSTTNLNKNTQPRQSSKKSKKKQNSSSVQSIVTAKNPIPSSILPRPSSSQTPRPPPGKVKDLNEFLPNMRKVEESTKNIKLNPGPSLPELEEILATYQSSELEVKNSRTFLKDLNNFYVIENTQSRLTEPDPITTLTHSIQASHKDNIQTYTYPGVHVGSDGIATKCDFEFGKNKNVIIHGIGRGQKEAKKDATEKALRLFKQLCPILQVKETIIATRKVERKELICEAGIENQAIDSPIGKNLLLKMGWKGGGLGLNEDGISEAIDVITSFGYRGRTGLGKDAKYNTGQFRKNIMKFLNGEALSFGEFDIEFSADFTAEERKMIHELATVSGCYKSKSHGKGANRFLVLSRKIDLSKLVQETLDIGGESVKYKVVLPKCF